MGHPAQRNPIGPVQVGKRQPKGFQAQSIVNIDILYYVSLVIQTEEWIAMHLRVERDRNNHQQGAEQKRAGAGVSAKKNLLDDGIPT
jgi:hypothetical protein